MNLWFIHGSQTLHYIFHQVSAVSAFLRGKLVYKRVQISTGSDSFILLWPIFLFFSYYSWHECLWLYLDCLRVHVQSATYMDPRLTLKRWKRETISGCLKSTLIVFHEILALKERGWRSYDLTRIHFQIANTMLFGSTWTFVITYVFRI